MSRPNIYPAELRQRAIRMVAAARPEYESEWAAVALAVTAGTPRRRA